PAPGDLPRQAQLIERRAIVAADPRRQDVALPRSRRRLEALELRENLGETLRAVELRPRRDVLPAEEEAEEVLRRRRLDLAPQPPERQPVDAREQRPLAPLGLGRALAVAALQDETLALQRRQLVVDVRDPQPRRQLSRGDRPDDADPAAN